jgi:hypothetical protein
LQSRCQADISMHDPKLPASSGGDEDQLRLLDKNWGVAWEAAMFSSGPDLVARRTNANVPRDFCEQSAAAFRGAGRLAQLAAHALRPNPAGVHPPLLARCQ